MSGLRQWWKRLQPEVGGAALRRKFNALFGDEEPITYEFGDVPIYVFHANEPVPHFLYTTFGLSRVNSATPVAGTQTELTIRIPDDQSLPPEWPARVLDRIVRYLNRVDNPLEPGHHMDFSEPLSEDSTLTALIFVTDPLLGVVDTASGFVRFTYAIGVTPDDLRDALIWDARKFAGVFGEYFPLGLSDPSRHSLRDIPEAHTILTSATQRQGSSLSGVMTKYLDFTDDPEVRIDLTSASAEHLLNAIRYRIVYGRSFSLVGKDRWLEIIPGDGAPLVENRRMVLEVSETLANELLATFDIVPGTYRFTTSPLTLQVFDPNR
ncbi:suppressor of fused domain protein [Corynebacterium cystitidis]|uniref:Suppressor of fused protein (SUFU) n=1 Tax=Corynebacterium cystitidis DSM 20524 TaxID=1121357 RepID=A0A1H9TNA9_9CORY|nr:suppressor of fused domain protein [Corynebacterium cystitidis]WJY82025.1 Suppressor of fused protein (SUFU) [Corynebacterium cystitidis DSM 20524]SER98547.1 Suppressor of fused protein (SUFU) [Corynebacterium cystitidis DSM 20524]SNV80640.1 suppressor of fused protein [Corynebacterium cystitidis]